ncbi:alpha-(1,3)-fucosyltransferase 6-like [Pelobates cultripes]|uniref:Fucosyltransferase n=1 Tax=Pelobates cultripes TaxID=61616 RepID=A0AAD1WXF6_PELCU|nr:alpha-(1,3)-fucosyltransferase 6-like [Pelobates cultripes]
MKPESQSTSCHKYVLVFLLITLFSFILFTYININRSSPDIEPTLIFTMKEGIMTILLWTWPFGDRFTLNHCENSGEDQGCFFTADRNYYLTANAVIFHHRDVCQSKSQMPQITRPPGQYWVWFNLESPSHSPNLGFMDNLINLTMSYRSDSDIFTPYGWLVKNNINQNFTIPKKTLLAAWVVSNWNPSSKRVQYYQELNKHMQIDVYGRQHKTLPHAGMQDTISKYKFYFSFENSQHRDYITEKLWRNALAFGAVPVILGSTRENYERFIPRDSFIHVDDFPSPKGLADYLHELDKDKERYERYFKWRAKLRSKSDNSWATHYCKACKGLKEAPAYRTMPSLVTWYT